MQLTMEQIGGLQVSRTTALAAAAAAASTAAAVAIFIAYRRRKQRRQPVSVGKYPIIGSHMHLKEPWYLDLHERFGHHPLVVVHFGTHPVYIFQQFDAFKEAMVENSEQLSGRLSQALTEQLFGDRGGLVASDGAIWREYRRFTLKTLRDFGFGRRAGEDLIAIEAEHLCRSIAESTGVGLETSGLFSTATSNVICQLVFGSRLASEDPKFSEILELFKKITQDEDTNRNNSFFLSILRVVERWPSIGALLIKLSPSQEVLVNFQALMKYCTQHRDQHAEELEGVQQAKDYIEAHLLHQTSNPEIFNNMRLTLAVSDLFLAGTDTTSHTLRWSILYLIGNPEVADKVYQEIVHNVGTQRAPGLKDRPNLHYTQAVLEEVMRRASLVPLGVLHRVTESITVAGYHMEKDAVCTFNVYSIHHDPQVFPKPMEFKPERHLNADGQFVACEKLATFGLGKRSCLGESLARAELFLFFTSIMQRFSFQLDPDEPKSLWELTESPEYSKGTVLRAPPKHKIVFIPRN